MQTLRGRLTASYSAALALTLAAFAVLLYLDRRSASYQDLDQRIQSEATLTAGILAESYRARGSLVRADTSGRPGPGGAQGGPRGRGGGGGSSPLWRCPARWGWCRPSSWGLGPPGAPSSRWTGSSRKSARSRTAAACTAGSPSRW